MVFKWNRSTLFWFVFILVCIVGFYFIAKLYVLDPLEEENGNLKKELDMQINYIEKSQSWQQTISTISEESLNALPIEKNNESMIRLIDRAKKESGINIDRVLVEEQPPNEESGVFEQLSYQLEGTAPTYDHFQQFVTNIEADKRLIESHEIKIDMLKDEKEVKFLLHFDAFYTPGLDLLHSNVTSDSMP
ncbi:type 4a pilus biogenesis protein PilO [Gracilibacillus massiliensis]|uniref:type 4a pilus biogenesis protein PilO n=1 Tax=Gracilibacillus massiliensis TaxID=1564956 RepID=UPI00071E0E83|nr:type 4a pilus biogenesis protein PilO [Gracilibacillus massiliensis]